MKIISVFLALITTFTSLFSLNGITDINKDGVPAITTGQIYFLDNLIGGQNNFDVSIDDMTKEICDNIKDNSALDIEMIVENLPDLNVLPRTITKVAGIDTVAFREAAYAYRDELLADGKETEALLVYFFGAYLSGFSSCDVYLRPVDGTSDYEFILDVTYEDGAVETIGSGIYYNTETKYVHGNTDKGMADIGFEFDAEQMIVYAAINSWMRDFGFCVGYDVISYITPFYFYNTRRFKFDYAGKEWMIQVWKGNYVVTNGSEVGVYNRDEGSIGTYYNCVGDEDMLKMSMQLYHGDDLIINIPEQYHWWVNGFRLSNTLYPANSLTVKFTIEMKDEEMLKAFTGAVDSNIWHDVSYTVDGLTVSLTW